MTGFQARKVPTFEAQWLAKEEARSPQRFEWTIPIYELTWDIVERHLRKLFPGESFQNEQISDFWIIQAPRPETQQDKDEITKLREKNRPPPQPRPESPE